MRHALWAAAELVAIASLAACAPRTDLVTPETLRYVALGDSYTIGTSVVESERWPDQLVEALGGEPTRVGHSPLSLVANLAVNGYTSQDLIDDELPQLDALRPHFLSVLIGVNDVVQGVPPETYRENLAAILDDLVRRVGSRRLVLVTIPDYTVTPAGADYGAREERSASIRAFNAIAAEEARSRGIAVVDVYETSLRAADDRSLVSSDGLHPSGQQYALWVELVAPTVRMLLG